MSQEYECGEVKMCEILQGIIEDGNTYKSKGILSLPINYEPKLKSLILQMGQNLQLGTKWITLERNCKSFIP
jgi:hypothetical protein